jgi:hypothetical protein
MYFYFCTSIIREFKGETVTDESGISNRPNCVAVDNMR